MTVHETKQIALLLLELYLVLGVMLIGFGVMFAGKSGGARAAEFYFGRSLRWALGRVRLLSVSVLALAWSFLLFWILRPLGFGLWLAARWFAGSRTRLVTALAALLLCALALVALAAASPATAQTVILQSQHHMFRATVKLNNVVDLSALIDTGASFLSMCHATAKTLRLQLGDSIQLSTANGIITARRAMVDSVRIGAIEVRNVGAVVKADGTSCDEGLLVGMSVLRKLHVTLDGQTLTLVAGRGMDTPALTNEWSVLAATMLVLLASLIRIRKRRRRLVLRVSAERSFRKGATFFRR